MNSFYPPTPNFTHFFGDIHSLPRNLKMFLNNLRKLNSSISPLLSYFCIIILGILLMMKPVNLKEEFLFCRIATSSRYYPIMIMFNAIDNKVQHVFTNQCTYIKQREIYFNKQERAWWILVVQYTIKHDNKYTHCYFIMAQSDLN